MISGGKIILLLRPVTLRNTQSVMSTRALSSWLARTEQRPDIGIADLGEQETKCQRDNRGEIYVAEQLCASPSACSMSSTENSS